MGNDLYWKITPKEPEEEYHGISYSTWHFLADLWRVDPDDLFDRILTANNIAELTTVSLTANRCGNITLAQDMNELIQAIVKYDSITLIIRG